jgi:hypothetical protein
MPDRRHSKVLITFAFAVALQAAQPIGQSSPVLVELFTSEGCSSCPPADLLLQRLERGQLVEGATVIAMSEHVDYWNHLGWTDPFSSAQMTARQQNYALRFHSDGPYTPQMVVDGVEEFVGSDAPRARRAIALSAARPKLEINAEVVAPGMVHVTAPGSTSSAEVFLALVYDPEPSQVARGENSGRRLMHFSVVKSLKRVGEVSRNKGFEARLPIPDDGRLANPQVVVFVQERSQGRVLGSAEVSLRQSAGMVARWSPQK